MNNLFSISKRCLFCSLSRSLLEQAVLVVGSITALGQAVLVTSTKSTGLAKAFLHSLVYKRGRGRSISSREKMGNCTTSEGQRAADATLASARAKEAYRQRKEEEDAAQAIVDQKNASAASLQKVEDDSVRENTIKIQEAIKSWMKPLNHEKNASLDDAYAASHLCYLQLPGRNMNWQVLRRLRSQKFDLIVSIGWYEKEGRTVAHVYHGWCSCCPSFCLSMPPQ